MAPFIQVVHDGNKYATIKYKNIEIETRFHEIEINDLFINALREIENEELYEYDKKLYKNNKHGSATLGLMYSAIDDAITIIYSVESLINHRPTLSKVKLVVPFDDFMQTE